MALISPDIGRVNTGFVAFTKSVIIAGIIKDNFLGVDQKGIGSRVIVGDGLIPMNGRRAIQSGGESSVLIVSIIGGVPGNGGRGFQTQIPNPTGSRDTGLLIVCTGESSAIFAPEPHGIVKVDPVRD